jgi:hypothetical protein
MLVRLRKAQSTAEYAITLGLIIAVVTGVLGAALKAGMRKKGAQTVDLLKDAATGDDSGDRALAEGLDTNTNGIHLAGGGNISIYNQQYRNTQITGSDSTSVMHRGGGEEKIQNQTSSTSSVEVETLGSVGCLTE